MLLELPNELMEMILSYLNNKDERLMRVNKLFYEMLNRKKCRRFKLIKNTLFDLQLRMYNFFMSIDEFHKLDNSKQLKYKFENIYNKCIFKDDSKIDYTYKNLCRINTYFNIHKTVTFDSCHFNIMRDLCFKIYKSHPLYEPMSLMFEK